MSIYPVKLGALGGSHFPQYPISVQGPILSFLKTLRALEGDDPSLALSRLLGGGQPGNKVTQMTSDIVRSEARKEFVSLNLDQPELGEFLERFGSNPAIETMTQLKRGLLKARESYFQIRRELGNSESIHRAIFLQILAGQITEKYVRRLASHLQGEEIRLEEEFISPPSGGAPIPSYRIVDNWGCMNDFQEFSSIKSDRDESYVVEPLTNTWPVLVSPNQAVYTPSHIILLKEGRIRATLSAFTPDVSPDDKRILRDATTLILEPIQMGESGISWSKEESLSPQPRYFFLDKIKGGILMCLEEPAPVLPAPQRGFGWKIKKFWNRIRGNGPWIEEPVSADAKWGINLEIAEGEGIGWNRTTEGRLEFYLKQDIDLGNPVERFEIGRRHFVGDEGLLDSISKGTHLIIERWISDTREPVFYLKAGGSAEIMGIEKLVEEPGKQEALITEAEIKGGVQIEIVFAKRIRFRFTS